MCVCEILETTMYRCYGVESQLWNNSTLAQELGLERRGVLFRPLCASHMNRVRNARHRIDEIVAFIESIAVTSR
jgi:hypothetical protein